MVSALTTTFDLNYSYRDRLPVIVTRFAGTGAQQRAALQVISRRSYQLPIQKTATEKASIDTFFRLLSQTVDAFYIRDPKDDIKEGVYLYEGTGGAVPVTFDFPTTGENSRDWPIAFASGAGTFTVYKNGTPWTTGSPVIDTGDRTITFNTAMTLAFEDVVSIDYKAYRLVVLEEDFQWVGLSPDFFEATLELQEVPA